MNIIIGIKCIFPSAVKGLVLGLALVGVVIGALFYLIGSSTESALAMGSLHSVWLLPFGLVIQLVYWLPLYSFLWRFQRNTYLTSCLIWVIPAATLWVLDFGVFASALIVQGIPVALISHWFVRRNIEIPNPPDKTMFRRRLQRQF